MNDLIEKLSNLRSQFNCFDENERDAYHTLSEAIKVLSEQPEPREDATRRCTYKPDCPWSDGTKCNSPNDPIHNECDYERGIFPESYNYDPRADVYYLAEKIGIHRLYALVAELRGEPEPCEDDKHCSNCIYSGRPIYKSPCSECHDNGKWEMRSISRSHENDVECEDAVSRKAAVEDIRRHGVGAFDFEDYTPEQAERFVIKLLQDLPSVTPKLCDDAVSRRILLNDLKELITAWEKYPVMAEQIKGVEIAIGYVERIPSIASKRNTGKWI